MTNPVQHTDFNLAITDQEFERFRRLAYDRAGIRLSEEKKSLLVGRLSKRLRHYGMQRFKDYYHFITDGAHSDELQTAIDLITTNETYFFREIKHFNFLTSTILQQRQEHAEPFRVWSAASSTGEEAYSVAMILAEYFGITGNWEIVATDISERVLAKARQGVYTEQSVEKIPPDYVNKYCLKGVRSQTGNILMDKRLRERISFMHMNLHGTWHKLGRFDVVFLRNVLIYFDNKDKSRLVGRIADHMKFGGHLFTGHAETLTGLATPFRMLSPSIYCLK